MIDYGFTEECFFRLCTQLKCLRLSCAFSDMCFAMHDCRLCAEFMYAVIVLCVENSLFKVLVQTFNVKWTSVTQGTQLRG